MKILIALLTSLFIAGCASVNEKVIVRQAAEDLKCQSAEIKINKGENQTWQAIGCGKSIKYSCWVCGTGGGTSCYEAK